jgi:hypothetical protein
LGKKLFANALIFLNKKTEKKCTYLIQISFPLPTGTKEKKNKEE